MISLALAGCGDAGDREPEAADEDAVEEPEGSPVVEVVLRDYAFADLPDSVAAGTRFTVVNESESELHELVAFHLPVDEDRSVGELAELRPDELVEALGEPVTVLLAEPGGPEIIAVGDGTLERSGRYAIMCFIPTGADPQEYLEAAAATEQGPPQVEGGPPHFVQACAQSSWSNETAPRDGRRGPGSRRVRSVITRGSTPLSPHRARAETQPGWKV